MGGTGALVIADVGQGGYEEIDYEPAGAGGRNYGWRNREGAHNHETSLPPFSTPLTDPIYEYGRTVGSCVTGGHVYRGQALGQSMVGRYFFADCGSRRVWSLGLDVNPVTHAATVTDVQDHTSAFGAATWVSFGADWAGELYVVDLGGRILRFDAGTKPTDGIFGDFDADRVADVTVLRQGYWYVLKSTTEDTGSAAYVWGLPSDVPAGGDYDGDGVMDIAVYRDPGTPATAWWYVLKSSTGFTSASSYEWGYNGDVPVPGDYDGDGRIDPAIYRPSTHVWYILRSSANYQAFTTPTLGASGDVLVPADYDGDGLTDVAIYRPAMGLWRIIRSATGTAMEFIWGTNAGPDVPVVGDYDGDGKADPTVFRASVGAAFVKTSSSNYTQTIVAMIGQPGDTPAPGDYDGDGRTDLGVYRPSSGLWIIRLSSSNFTTIRTRFWGVSSDVPLYKKP